MLQSQMQQVARQSQATHKGARGSCDTWTCSLITRVALSARVRADGQRLLFITKGNPTLTVSKTLPVQGEPASNTKYVF
jgi:hypothetical protein